MDSYDILVIILSVALAVSTILWIFAAIMIIQLIKKAKATAETANQAVENVQEFTNKIKMVGDVSAIGSAVSQAAKFFNKHKKEEK